MPDISIIGKNLPASPIRKLVPYADAAKSKGITVYHLNIGQPDIATPRIMMEAVAEAAHTTKVLEYSHSAGNLSLRKKQVDYYKQFQIDITDKDILMTTGGSEAIHFAMNVCLNEGDEIIIPEPFYANYNTFAMIARVKIIPIRSYIDNRFALPDISAIAAAITPKTKAIMICNPNNPTGYLYSQQELEELAALAREKDLYLFSDEAYKEFCYDGNAFYSALQIPNMESNVIVFDTISKRYSACGARLGALVSKNKSVIDAALKMAQARLSPPSFAQIMAEAAAGLPLDYFQEIKNEYLSRRDYLVQRLTQMPGVKCPTPGGAFYAIAELPIDDSNKFCQWLLESFSHENQTVMLAPASGFYATAGAGTQEVRLAYVLSVDKLEKAMDCLQIALATYNNL